jgi:hypothetical protein
VRLVLDQRRESAAYQLHGAVAMNKRLLLVGAWSLVAAILLVVGVIDVLRWRADPDFVRIGLTWMDSYLPHGILAGTTAAACLWNHRFGRWLTVMASSLLGLYYAAYLVLGGEGAVLLRVVVPIILVALSATTIRYVLRRQAAPP